MYKTILKNYLFIKLKQDIRFISATPSTPIISINENDGLRRIKMIDNKTRNALSLKMMTELQYAIDENNSNNILRCIIIENDGHVFSAGHNLKELTNTDLQCEIFSKCTDLMLSIQKSSVPVIGVVNGLAAAAGCQLVSACDFSFATPSSTFSTPGANFGLFCSTPGVSISRVINRSTAAYMVLTGHSLNSQQAFQAGLIVKIVPEDQIESEIQTIYKNIKNKSRPILKLGKEYFYKQLNLTYEDALRKGEQVMLKNLKMNDSKEGLNSFKEKRTPKWTHEE